MSQNINSNLPPYLNAASDSPIGPGPRSSIPSYLTDRAPHNVPGGWNNPNGLPISPFFGQVSSHSSRDSSPGRIDTSTADSRYGSTNKISHFQLSGTGRPSPDVGTQSPVRPPGAPPGLSSVPPVGAVRPTYSIPFDFVSRRAPGPPLSHDPTQNVPLSGTGPFSTPQISSVRNQNAPISGYPPSYSQAGSDYSSAQPLTNSTHQTLNNPISSAFQQPNRIQPNSDNASSSQNISALSNFGPLHSSQQNLYRPPTISSSDPANVTNRQPAPVPPVQSGPTSLPFPNRQINSNLPPLISSQGSAQTPVQNVNRSTGPFPSNPSQPSIPPSKDAQNVNTAQRGNQMLNANSRIPPLSNSNFMNSNQPPPMTMYPPPPNSSQPIYPAHSAPQSNYPTQSVPPQNYPQNAPQPNYSPQSAPQLNYPPQNTPQPNYPPQITPQPGYPAQSAPQPATAPGTQPHGGYGQYPQQMPGPTSAAPQYATPNHYNGQQDLNQQMGRLNVTQSGINKLWGNESVDLLQCRNILPEGKVEPPIIKLKDHFTNSVNCSPDIFRCTLTRIPETNNLLQKSRLPLGILIHPFKDLSHLPVIQCNSIVRCRSCRTYINPFVYFIDLKRWKCNLCYRVNDLPAEFQYDPVTKSYGDPTRRPEIQSATIEYIAPSEYMLRPPQPAAYLFLLDVSASAAESGYLKLFCETLTEEINNLPGDTRTQLAFICYDSAIHFYYLGEGASRPREMTVIDIDDVFLPSPEDLLVNLSERHDAILELLAVLPTRHANPSPSANQSALGAALKAAQRLMAPTGGRVSVFQTCLANVGPGALTAREDPNNRSSKDVAHLNPATDYYKREALEYSVVQVAVDLFLLNSQYADLSTLSGISRFSGGSIYHLPLFKASREWQAQEFKRCLTRYLVRKIGFEAVMRVRCTRGLAIHTFHGSFFVRSTDLLSLPNVSPDSGFGMQIAIEENLSDAQHVCFQAALLYTSSKGERRIRVHTLCVPVTSTLSDVIHSADQQCIIGLLAKMAVDRSQTSSLSDAREALINAAVDALGTVKVVQGPSHGLMSPMTLRLLPLYLLALLKYKAFRTGTSTRLDDRVAAMCNMKSLPLANLIRSIYPDLYPVHKLLDYVQPSTSNDNEGESEEFCVPNPPRLRLSAEKVNATGAYLLDQEDTMVLYVGHTVHPTWLKNTLGVEQHSQIRDDLHSIPTLDTEENALLHSFIYHLNDEKPFAATLHIIRDNSPNRSLFIDKLVDDRVEAALSYYEFLQHIKSQMK